MREVEEERPVAVRVDEALRLGRQVVLALAAFGLARLGRRLAGVLDVESLIARHESLGAEVPLANHRRGVARRAQPLGQRRLFERELLPHHRVQELL